MASWVLIPSLDRLFFEFDQIDPLRDHASDGKVGNELHAQTSSDHNPDETGNVPIHDVDKINEVHAIDVDNNFSRTDITMEKVVQFLLGRCRSGKETRLRYIIYNKRIWSASSDWVQKTYTGPSAHTEHAHFSGSYETPKEAAVTSWGLIEEFGRHEVSLPKQGDTGEDVIYWQYLINYVAAKLKLGSLAVDGNYGPTTAAMVGNLYIAFGGKATYNGSYLSGWTAFMIQREFAKSFTPPPVVTAPIIDPALIQQAVTKYLAVQFPEGIKIVGNIEGSLVAE